MPEKPSRIVPVRIVDLPKSITAQASERIKCHCVSLIVANDDPSEGIPCSGVLCVVHGVPGLLTAWHVWDSLLKAKTLVMMLGPRHPYCIARSSLIAIAPDPTKKSDFSPTPVPDIAFIHIPSEAKTLIEAKNKVFYSIDRRRDNLDFDLYGSEGFWAATGTPVELMQRHPPLRTSLTRLVYWTDIEKVIEEDGWDYLRVNLNLDYNSIIPSNLQGMSGGGIWRIVFRATESPDAFSLADPSRDIMLQGITFAQTDLKGRQLIAHGPKSIYQRLYDMVQ